MGEYYRAGDSNYLKGSVEDPAVQAETISTLGSSLASGDSRGPSIGMTPASSIGAPGVTDNGGSLDRPSYMQGVNPWQEARRLNAGSLSSGSSDTLAQHQQTAASNFKTANDIAQQGSAYNIAPRGQV